MADFLAEKRVGRTDPDALKGHTTFTLKVMQYINIAHKAI
jgi:hypothetical protein